MSLFIELRVVLNTARIQKRRFCISIAIGWRFGFSSISISWRLISISFSAILSWNRSLAVNAALVAAALAKALDALLDRLTLETLDSYWEMILFFFLMILLLILESIWSVFIFPRVLLPPEIRNIHFRSGLLQQLTHLTVMRCTLVYPGQLNCGCKINVSVVRCFETVESIFQVLEKSNQLTHRHSGVLGFMQNFP